MFPIQIKLAIWRKSENVNYSKNLRYTANPNKNKLKSFGSKPSVLALKQHGELENIKLLSILLTSYPQILLKKMKNY
jgi:hypothetical protein